MKKLFSLLFVALLAMTAWAADVTLDFSTNSWGFPVGSTNKQVEEQQFTNGTYTITLTGTAGNGYAWYTNGSYLLLGKQGATLTLPAFDQPVEKIAVTGTSGASTAVKQNIFVNGTAVSSETTGAKDVVNEYVIDASYRTAGTIYTLQVTSAHNTQLTKIEVFFEGSTAPAVEAPVFNPNGGEFTVNSLAVTVSCPTENASIMLYKVVDGEDEYQGYYFQSGEFYVTETSTYRAYAYKGDDMSEYTTVSFTKVTPKVATPTFNPASGTEFEDELDVTISCATPGATILYSYGDVIDEAEAPVTITLNDNATITAIASLDGYEDSEEATATYIKKEPAPAATYQLVTDVTTLQAGDKIALVGKHEGDAFVMSVERSNNFGGAAVLNGNEFATNEAFVLTLEVANDTTWNLKTDNGKYLYANSSSNNQLKTEASVDNNGNANAMITNGENNAASIVFKGTSTRNVLQFNYNGNNPTLFSCYASASQAPVYIYKQMSEVVMPAAPTISPESKEFTEPLEVTITNNDQNGAIVKYALNDGEFATYEAPFTVTETTTVKAYAEKDGVTSDLVTATYTYVPVAVTVANLAAVEELDSADVFTFTGNIVVTHKNGKNLWVRDDSGSALIYNTTDSTIVKGVVIAPNWGGRKTLYLGQTEIDNLKDFAASGTTQEVAPFERETLTMDNYAEYVIIKNVSIDSTYTSGNRTNYVTNTGIIVRNNWNVAFSPVEGTTYDIIGVVSAYDGNPQLYLIEQTPHGGVDPGIPEVGSITDALALANGAQFSYTGEAVVVYHPASDLRYTYIYDGEKYGLIYDSNKTIPAMDKGTILKDEWTAVRSEYNGAPQFINPEGVEASEDDPVEVNPIEMTEVTVDDAHKYVMMKGQTLTATGANKTWANADGLLFYNRFNLDLTIEDGKTYDVEAMVGTFKVSGEYVPEIFIISATEVVASEWEVGDVNHDHNIDVSDVTLLIAYVLGNNPEGFFETEANVNDGDDNIDVGDVTALIAKVLAN